ncbi:restriction endonuclease subunit S [Flavihumibacter stibioxidans]|nr:restriction endonuclease subunit S [Flavihumibacter stibioxidans]
MSDWKEIPLGKVLEFGNGKVKPKRVGKIPIYGGNGILGFGNDFNYENETIIIGRVGAYCGSVYYENRPIWVSDNALAAKPKQNYDAKFIYYFLKHIDLNRWAGGSSHPLVTQTLLKSLEFSICTNPKVQCDIAEVLSSLDDKIDLLHRNNKTLEQMAETLFRHFFGLDTNDSWESVSAMECFRLIGGGTPATTQSAFWGGNIKWMSAKDITEAHKGFILSTEKTITVSGLQNSSTKILPKFATVISARGTVGKYCMLAEPMCFSQSNYGILPVDDESFFFTHLLVASLVKELQAASYGTVFDTITTRTFSDIKVPLPPHELVKNFNEIVSPFFEKMLLNSQQMESIRKLRDSLLPKLIAGEIIVSTELPQSLVS